MSNEFRDLRRDRISRRKFYLDRALERAKETAPERSLSCLRHDHRTAVDGGDLTSHPTCAGLKAAGPLGCLCPCHDPGAESA